MSDFSRTTFRSCWTGFRLSEIVGYRRWAVPGFQGGQGKEPEIPAWYCGLWKLVLATNHTPGRSSSGHAARR